MKNKTTLCLPRILFVDDELSVLETFQSIFRKQFEVTIAQSAMEALGLLRMGLRFDVIVSDIMMPFMDGVEFLSNAKMLAPLSGMLAKCREHRNGMEISVVMRDFSIPPRWRFLLCAVLLSAVHLSACARPLIPVVAMLHLRRSSALSARLASVMTAPVSGK